MAAFRAKEHATQGTLALVADAAGTVAAGAAGLARRAVLGREGGIRAGAFLQPPPRAARQCQPLATVGVRLVSEYVSSKGHRCSLNLSCFGSTSRSVGVSGSGSSQQVASRDL